MSLLEIENLRVGYGFHVLMGISVAVEEGETAVMFGLKGAGMGGAAAALLFILIGLFARAEGPTPEEAQLRSLFGGMSVGLTGYLGSAITVIALALIIAVTARWTVRRTLSDLD